MRLPAVLFCGNASVFVVPVCTSCDRPWTKAGVAADAGVASTVTTQVDASAISARAAIAAREPPRLDALPTPDARPRGRLLIQTLREQLRSITDPPVDVESRRLVDTGRS